MFATARFLDHYIGVLSHAGAIVSTVMVLLTTALLAVNSCARYLFNAPFLFVDEYAQYLLVGIFYLGVGYTLRKGKHVSVDMLVSRFGRRVRLVLAILTGILGLVLIYLMCKYGWTTFLSSYKRNITSLTPMETPLWIPYLFVAVGLTVFLLDLVAYILTRMARLMGADDTLGNHEEVEETPTME